MIIALAFVGLLLVGVQWLPVIVTGCLFLFGIGGGYFQPANISTIMQSGSTNNQGTIGSLQRMIQNIAIANGTRTIPLRVDTLNNKSVISRGCFE
ncbi:hypothetical protein [Limosilactobacillus fermentum]|uniref:hypothetical protein n=1 Tax=Limosilactobacillus fermentum TaxID=1613 RepID=UPI0019D651E4|nr:hypothetical protein [Limosilactobacillus fermentum]